MNIIIVDDEQIIVTWLKKNIESISPDYRVVKVCSNGQQAFEYCLENNVDVIFTDIRMPIMDGISLMNSLKSHNRLSYTILLTAYDDFDYARQALQLGAKEFLLKTEISEDILRKSLADAGKIILHSSKQDDPSSRIFIDLVKEGKCGDINIWNTFFQQGLMTMLLEIQDKTALVRCTDILNYVYVDEAITPYMVSINDFLIAIFSDLPTDVDEFLQKSKMTLSSFGIDCYIITSSSDNKPFDPLSIYKDAKDKLHYHNYYQTQEKLELSQTHITELDDIEQNISNLIRIKSYTTMIEVVEKWLRLVECYRPELFRVHNACMRFLLQIYWENIPTKERQNLPVDRIVRIIETERFTLFKPLFLQRIEDLLALLPDYEKTSYSSVVSKAILYMKTKYTQPLTLNDIAEAVHLNRSYLSTLFKKEVEINLFEYLQQYRLAMAKDLLLQKKISIGQVCEQVGLPDAAYFSKLFKKQYGLTPHDYRKQHSNQTDCN